MRGDVSLVELHTLGELELHRESLAILDVHHAVLADLLQRVGDDGPDLLGASADGAHADHVVPAGDLHSLFLDSLNGDLGGLLDPTPQEDRVGASRHVLDALVDYRLRQNERRRRAVAGHVVGLEGDLLDELGGLILEDVPQVYLLGDGHAVVRYSRRDQGLVQDHVLALGT